jgi:aspartate/methionine/tyrosine aminotransferase
MPSIGSRTRHFSESVIRRMTRVANSVGAINLSQGYPDFDAPAALLAAAEAEWLAREAGVAAMPGSSFFAEPEHRSTRFHLAKKVDTLVEAGKRVARTREKWATLSTR